ncbi:MAG: SDR family oxidoreductase [Thermomicrobiales bacterium]|jgi:3-oxoacyl-[acyl-carrier protein] reductase|nr:SDR family oxidoreductase [Thermomicrobiales bacterium]
MPRLQDRVCVVTGAGRGIGRGIATAFLSEGASVWICDINPSTLEQTLKDLAAPDRLDGCVTDVTSRAACQAMFDQAVARFGRVDAVVNNAGGGIARAFVDIDDDLWAHEIALNLTGVFHCAQIGARLMLAQGEGGSIINIGSTNGLYGQAGMAPYGAAKAGVINMSKSMALELGEHGIRVNALCPGTILSGGEYDDPDHPTLTLLRSHTAVNRLGRVEDIAAAAVYLASNESTFMSGHAMVVDGGATARQLLMTATPDTQNQTVSRHTVPDSSVS